MTAVGDNDRLASAFLASLRKRPRRDGSQGKWEEAKVAAFGAMLLSFDTQMTGSGDKDCCAEAKSIRVHAIRLTSTSFWESCIRGLSRESTKVQRVAQLHRSQNEEGLPWQKVSCCGRLRAHGPSRLLRRWERFRMVPSRSLCSILLPPLSSSLLRRCCVRTNQVSHLRHFLLHYHHR